MTIQDIVTKHYDEALQESYKVFNIEIDDLVVEIKTTDGLTVRQSYRDSQKRLEDRNL